MYLFNLYSSAVCKTIVLSNRHNICVCIYVLTIYDRPARKCAPRAPGLGNLPRQKSLDSSLAAVQLAMQGSSNNTQGSVSNIYNQ